MVKDLQRSILLEPQLARTLAGRFTDSRWIRETEYRLSMERTGMFAIVPEDTVRTVAGARVDSVVVTYLRLGQPQREFALKHWPLEDPNAPPPPPLPEPVPPIKQLLARVHLDIGVPIRVVLVLRNLAGAFGSANKARVAMLGLRAEPGGPPTRFVVPRHDGQQLRIEVRETNVGRLYAGVVGDDGDDFPV